MVHEPEGINGVIEATSPIHKLTSKMRYSEFSLELFRSDLE